MMNDELSPPLTLTPIPWEVDFYYFRLPGVTLRSPPAVFLTPLQGLSADARERDNGTEGTTGRARYGTHETSMYSVK